MEYTVDDTLAEELSLALRDIETNIEALKTLPHEHNVDYCHVCAEIQSLGLILEEQVRDTFGNPVGQREREGIEEFENSISLV